MDSLEVVDFSVNVDGEEWEDVTGEKLEPLYLQWKNVVSFEPLDSSESFRIMENFVMQMTDARAQGALMDILSKRKPFAHFNSYIHQSKYRVDWFKFRSAAYEKQVRETIFHQLNSDR